MPQGAPPTHAGCPRHGHYSFSAVGECKEYSEHEEHTDKVHFPLHGPISHTSRLDCYNPVFLHWGHDAPLSAFFQMSYYPSSAIKGISQEQSHCISRTDDLIIPQVPAGAWATPLKFAEQLLSYCFCDLLPTSPNPPALWDLTICPQLAIPGEVRWTDYYQSNRLPSLP